MQIAPDDVHVFQCVQVEKKKGNDSYFMTFLAAYTQEGIQMILTTTGD